MLNFNNFLTSGTRSVTSQIRDLLLYNGASYLVGVPGGCLVASSQAGGAVENASHYPAVARVASPIMIIIRETD